MRILHCIWGPAAGGVETYVRQLAIEFRKEGHEPVLAFLNHASTKGRSEEFERAYLAELDAWGVEHFFLSRTARANPLKGALEMRRQCAARGIEAYHSHLKRGLLFGALLEVPRVTTHHNFVPQSPLWAFAIYNRFVDCYVGISEVCAEQLRQFTGREVTVIRNGIDAARFRPRTRHSQVDGPLKMIAVGRVHPQKNYPLLIEAMALLPQPIRHRLKMQIVGEGPKKLVDELKRLIGEAGLSQTIELLGNRTDVPKLLEQADILVMSSAWEGYPIALLEATASGLPFVATDVGGCRELAQLSGNGIIVPPKDPKSLAEAICRLATTPSELERLSHAARENIPTLSITRSADEHLALYEQLLRRSRRPALRFN